MRGLPRLAVAAAVAAVLLSAPAAGQEPALEKTVPSVLGGAGLMLGGPVNLTADTLDYDEETGVAMASGNVEVGFGNRTLRAERIRYDSRTGEAELAGKVHYKEAGDEFSFDRITLNFQTELGVLYNGSIRIASKNYQIASERFEKTGPRTFVIERGTLTTCPCDPEPDWKLDIRRASVTIDGYAVAKSVTFRIRGVPVLWLPYGAFPVKLTRQSGLLVPGFGSSPSRGFSVQLPLYWAINRWSDATLTLDSMSRRGLRPELEYRYVLDPRSEGEARVSVFHDRVTANERFRVDGSNTYRYADRWYSNAKWDVASDDRYYQDLVDPDILRTARHVSSRAFAGRNADDTHEALSAVWTRETQGIVQDNTVQRLPEFTATFLQGRLGRTGVDASGELAATYFYRRVDRRELRGRGYGEMSRTFTLYPSVTLSPFIALDVLGAYPTSDPGEGSKAGRVLPGGGAELDASIFRSYPGQGGSPMIHTVQTAVGFRWIPLLDQSDIPITDYWSRVRAQQQFTFSVNQRLLRIDEKSGPVELAFLALEWAVDVGDRPASGSPYVDPLSPFVRSLRDQIDLGAGRPTQQGAASSDVYARFQVRPRGKWVFSGEMLVDTALGNFTTASLAGEWKQADEKRALLEYRVSRDLSEDLHGLLAVRPIRILGLQTDVNYSIRFGALTEGSATFTLYPRSECWSIGLTASRKSLPAETGFNLHFSLQGIGSMGK